MKRRPDLEREILLAVENDDHLKAWVDLSCIQGHSENAVSYHVMLLHEAKLIEGLERSDMNAADGKRWHAKRLTFAGHEYLDKIRDPEIWRQTKEGADKIGSWSLDTLGQLARGFIKVQVKKLTGEDIDV